MSPEPSRSYDSSDCTIVTETLVSGDFLVNLYHGAVSMRLTVPATHIPFLFPLPVGSHPGAAGAGAQSAPASPHSIPPYRDGDPLAGVPLDQRVGLLGRLKADEKLGLVPNGPNTFAISPCVPAVPAQGEAGADTAIHGCADAGSVPSGAPLPDAAEAGEAPRPCLSCGGAHSVAASPATDPAGGQPSRVTATGSATRVCHTELGWVRSTRLADGGWYLSMRDGAHQVACFLADAEVQALFGHGERP